MPGSTVVVRAEPALMPRSTRKVLLVPILAAAALLGSGCSSTVPGTAAPVGGSPAPAGGGGDTAPLPTDDPVAWMDQVCGVMLPLTVAPAGAEFDPGQTPEETLNQLRETVTKGAAAMETAIDGLGAVGPSPITGGDEFVQQMSTTLGTAKTAFDGVAQKLEDVDPNDPAGFATAFSDLATTEGLEGLEDPGKALKTNPELEAAAEQAPKCQQLNVGG
jgi:hypothetical protein